MTDKNYFSEIPPGFTKCVPRNIETPTIYSRQSEKFIDDFERGRQQLPQIPVSAEGKLQFCLFSCLCVLNSKIKNSIHLILNKLFY